MAKWKSDRDQKRELRKAGIKFTHTSRNKPKAPQMDDVIAEELPASRAFKTCPSSDTIGPKLGKNLQDKAL